MNPDEFPQQVDERIREMKKSLVACERAQAKLARAGRHVEALKYVRMKTEIEEMIRHNTRLAETLQELHANRDLRGFLSKTMILTVSVIDLATFYIDTVNKFFSRREIKMDPDAMAVEQAGRKALDDLRRHFISRLRMDDMDQQSTDVFDTVEQFFAENTFTDREMVYYKEYSE